MTDDYIREDAAKTLVLYFGADVNDPKQLYWVFRSIEYADISLYNKEPKGLVEIVKNEIFLEKAKSYFMRKMADPHNIELINRIRKYEHCAVSNLRAKIPPFNY